MTEKDFDFCSPTKSEKDAMIEFIILILTKIEDLINTTFQLILIIFVFKMINVYNVARCDTVQELKRRNLRVNRLAYTVISVIIIT
jgi:hypothetical protein